MWPPDFEPCQDLSAAEWIRPRLLPWGAEVGTPVTSIVPGGFEAYVRSFHPARAAEAKDDVTWQEVADWSGGTFHPLAQFDAMADPVRPNPEAPPFDSAPSVGRLPPAIREVLVRELARLTETPSACYFGIWDGDGILSTGSSVTLLSVRGLRHRVRHRRHHRDEKLADWQREVSRLPRFEHPNRSYLLGRGPIGVACAGHSAT